MPAVRPRSIVDSLLVLVVLGSLLALSSCAGPTATQSDGDGETTPADSPNYRYYFPDGREAAIAAFEAAGSRLLEQHDFVLYQYLIILEGPR